MEGRTEEEKETYSLEQCAVVGVRKERDVEKRKKNWPAKGKKPEKSDKGYKEEERNEMLDLAKLKSRFLGRDLKEAKSGKGRSRPHKREGKGESKGRLEDSQERSPRYLECLFLSLTILHFY